MSNSNNVLAATSETSLDMRRLSMSHRMNLLSSARCDVGGDGGGDFASDLAYVFESLPEQFQRRIMETFAQCVNEANATAASELVAAG